MPYLGAAYLAQGAFKEPLQALLLIGFALGIREFASGGIRTPVALAVRGLPLAVIAAGSVFNYSFPGLLWLALTAVGVWLAAGAPVRALRPALPVVAVVAAVAAVIAIPEWGRILEFSDFRAFEPLGLADAREPAYVDLAAGGPGRLALGRVRVTPSTATLPAIAFYLGALLGATALASGLWRCLRERRFELPSALAAAGLVYLGAIIFGTPYIGAKALAIAAPVAMLIALWGVLSTDWLPQSEESRLLSWIPIPRARLSLGLTALAIAFVLAAAASSVLALRQSPVSPAVHERELNEIRHLVKGGRVLFLGRDDFIAWELRGASVDTPIENFYNVGQPPTRFKGAEKFDFDAVNEGILDRYRYVLTTSSAYASEPPGNFKEVERTPSFVLYKRRGPTVRRETLHEIPAPGAVLSCEPEAGHKRPQPQGVAEGTTVVAVWPRPPVEGSERKWEPSATATVDAASSQSLRLPPGRWQISLAYDSPRPLTIRASGSGVSAEQSSLLLPANLDFRGPSPPFPAGVIEVSDEGRVEFEVELAAAPAFGRLLGAEGEAHLRGVYAAPLGEIEHVPPRSACGEYVDWLRVRE